MNNVTFIYAANRLAAVLDALRDSLTADSVADWRATGTMAARAFRACVAAGTMLSDATCEWLGQNPVPDLVEVRFAAGQLVAELVSDADCAVRDAIAAAVEDLTAPPPGLLCGRPIAEKLTALLHPSPRSNPYDWPPDLLPTITPDLSVGDCALLCRIVLAHHEAAEAAHQAHLERCHDEEPW
jgi:hypothetical protein